MSQEVLWTIESLIPKNQQQAQAGILKVNSDFSYMAPELVSQRWDKLWAFMIQEIIPHDDEPWILPIKEYWMKVVPTRNNNKEQEAREARARAWLADIRARAADAEKQKL